MNYIANNTPGNSLVYFHNLSYDATFIIKEYLSVRDFLIVDGNILQFKVYYENNEITFRDSLRIFGEKLVKLPKMFLSADEQNNICKEIFAYEYYNKNSYIKNIGNIIDAFKFVHTPGVKVEDFKTSITKADALLTSGTFDL